MHLDSDSTYSEHPTKPAPLAPESARYAAMLRELRASEEKQRAVRLRRSVWGLK